MPSNSQHLDLAGVTAVNPKEGGEARASGTREGVSLACHGGSGTAPSVSFDPSARTWAGIQGGVAIGAMLEAAGGFLNGRIPVAATTHFHAPISPGSAQLSVSVQAKSRTLSSAKVTLNQARPGATMTALFTDPGSRPEALHWLQTGPTQEELRRPPESLPAFPAPVDVVPISRHFDIRPLGSGRPLAGGATPHLRAWIRYAAGSHPTSSIPVVLDALFPSIYATRKHPQPMPTAEMTIHFAQPTQVTEWLLIDQRTAWSWPGLCVDDCELWTSDGNLVAHARQTRRMLEDRPAR
ncbi:thioesterase family protein [Ruicaihuangia caeni]|uniref:thioesterase family protein n=1 Tax=Ruicaihuangia caeni TaxID=3042517 RepID=UPI0033900C75